MKCSKSAHFVSDLVERAKSLDKRVGFVPTMGALHEGHVSLVRKAKSECDFVVVSIYVNPIQFGEESDLVTYPKPIDKDMSLLIEAGVDCLFLPTYDEMYPSERELEDVDLGELEFILEGKQRPGHFQGVAKVVKRFFDIVKPDATFFGQKDFQQTVVVRRLINLFDLPIDLVVCPIIRESHGLAQSSRNERLSESDRQEASFIYRALLNLKESCYHVRLEDAITKTRLFLGRKKGANLEYLAAVDGYTMKEVQTLSESDYVVVVTVVEFGGVRLLDNLVLKEPQ